MAPPAIRNQIDVFALQHELATITANRSSNEVTLAFSRLRMIGASGVSIPAKISSGFDLSSLAAKATSALLGAATSFLWNEGKFVAS